MNSNKSPSDNGVRTAHPNGHFYSPVVDPTQVDATRTWPAQPEVLGIDFNDAGHEQILREVFPRHMPAWDYPERIERTPESTQFFTQNPAFSWLDARTLFVLLNEWRPRRLIEVGSGFSTLLAADVNRRFLDGACDITCIEPYPLPFLRAGVAGVS